MPFFSDQTPACGALPPPPLSIFEPRQASALQYSAYQFECVSIASQDGRLIRTFAGLAGSFPPPEQPPATHCFHASNGGQPKRTFARPPLRLLPRDFVRVRASDNPSP